MNRRSFLDTMLKGAAAFTILPGAGRIWKAEKSLYRWLPNNNLSLRGILMPKGIVWFLPSFQDFLAMKEAKLIN